MEFVKFLAQAKPAVLDRWFLLVVETYPPLSANLLVKESNEFANPVGHTLRRGIEGLYEGLLGELDDEELARILDRIVRIRAVQDFSPAQAIGFIFLLKGVIREEMQKDAWKDLVSPADLPSFESRIDGMALLAFNVYMACREKLYEVRLNEFKGRTFRLLQRANLLGEIPGWDPNSSGGDT